jgi:hypothetical protein
MTCGGGAVQAEDNVVRTPSVSREKLRCTPVRIPRHAVPPILRAMISRFIVVGDGDW